MKTGEEKSKANKMAVILVRGKIDMRAPTKDTLKFLRLGRKNFCVVLENTPTNLGMIARIKDYATWGEIDEETYNELIKKRGEEYEGPEKDPKGKISYSGRYFVHSGKKYKKYFRLSPPRKGFGRKGIKMPFKVGGALGYRGKKINDLIRRMI